MEGGVEGRQRCLSAIQSDVDDDTCVTFVLNGEDHTLGNPLRYMVMKNPDVDFCGYSVTHPSEDKINFRIQTRGIPAVDTFRRGLCELTTVCEHILAAFEASVNTYNTSHGIAGPMDQS
uniref:DNA-directed RNA polymerases I and III subunit RPAC2 n=1 Tax=Petromyzon marinus TaxID=7757 RepID=A0AAJ7T4R8_PETMA|nr:DNA-directed RNA polymerases I and III subunit RPAC2-like [Petromyzon marinus]